MCIRARTDEVLHRTTAARFERDLGPGGSLDSDREFVPDDERDRVLVAAGVPRELRRDEDTWVMRVTTRRGRPDLAATSGLYAVGVGPGYSTQRVLIVGVGARP